jgi:hypothetical protein
MNRTLVSLALAAALLAAACADNTAPPPGNGAAGADAGAGGETIAVYPTTGEPLTSLPGTVGATSADGDGGEATA